MYILNSFFAADSGYDGLVIQKEKGYYWGVFTPTPHTRGGEKFFYNYACILFNGMYTIIIEEH